jgi:GxxExxY protein
MEVNELTRKIIDAANKAHQPMGPGLMARAYATTFERELLKAGLRGVPPAEQAGDRFVLLVDDAVLVEVKAAEITPAQEAQMLADLRQGGKKIGLLLNFNVRRLHDGVKRIDNP